MRHPKLETRLWETIFGRKRDQSGSYGQNGASACWGLRHHEILRCGFGAESTLLRRAASQARRPKNGYAPGGNRQFAAVVR
jgi:hypothetical protein